MNGISIRAVDAREVRRAGEMMARVFQDDPVYVRILPDPRRRAEILPGLLESAVELGHCFGKVLIAFPGDTSTIPAVGDEPLGVAIWYPPGRPHPPWWGAFLVPARFSILKMPVSSFRRIWRLARLEKKHHPREVPHWYLAGIGEGSTFQRQGVGTALMEEGLRRADSDGMEAFLWTVSEETGRYYHRFGFRPARAYDQDGIAFRGFLRPPAVRPLQADGGPHRRREGRFPGPPAGMEAPGEPGIRHLPPLPRGAGDGAPCARGEEPGNTESPSRFPRLPGKLSRPGEEPAP